MGIGLDVSPGLVDCLEAFSLVGFFVALAAVLLSVSLEQLLFLLVLSISSDFSMELSESWTLALEAGL